MRTLHLDDHFFPAEQHGPMDLCDGSRAQRLWIKSQEHLFRPTAIFTLQDRTYGIRIHRSHLGAQLHQLIAVTLGKHILPG